MVKKTIFIGFIFLATLNSLSASGQDQKTKILNILENQQNEWNNGNIENFMNGYWESDSLIFIGKSGLNYGYSKVLSNYKNNYADKKAMGILTFDIKKIELLSSKQAIVIGSWSLERESDNPSGMFTLFFKKIKGEWKIVMDHSS